MKMLVNTEETLVAKRKEELQNYLRLLSAHEEFRNDKDENLEELKKVGAQGAATWKETLLAPLARVKEGVAETRVHGQLGRSNSQP